MPYIDKSLILNRLTKDDVIKVVVSLGSNGYKTGSSGELIFQSVCHNSASWKLYYYHEAQGNYPAKIFHCYSGCGDSFGIVELVIRANRTKGKTISFYKALMYIGNVTGLLHYVTDKKQEEVTVERDDWSWFDRFTGKTQQPVKQLKTYSEHILEMFCYIPHEEFLKDKISPETLAEFEIGYWGLKNQITIPHRDIEGNLIGVRARNLDPWEIANVGKYLPMNIQGQILSHPLGNNLYGIHINQKHIREVKKVLLLESEKGVMQNHTYFGDSDFALAVCGSNITQAQIDLMLKTLKVQEVIVGFDKEFHEVDGIEADLYRNKIYKKIAPIVPFCKVCVLWDSEGLLDYKDAPTDKGKEVLLKLLDKKIEISSEDIKDAFNTTYNNGG